MNYCLCSNIKNKVHKTIYKGKIRDGAYPKKTNKKFKVTVCEKCDLARLKPLPTISYESKEYRKKYNINLNIKSFKKFSNVDQKPEFFDIKRDYLKNKNLLDYGCGYGFFLDNVNKDVKQTYAIEPQINLQHYIKKKGHKLINYITPEKQFYNYIDIVTSFGVIEHTSDPLKYLKNAYKLLKKNGSLFLFIDNLNDILVQSHIKEFKEFYFRTAHYWYFTEKSLKKILTLSGFREIKIKYIHNHGFNNFIHWMKKKKPLNDNNLMKNKTNVEWIKTLKKIKATELIFVSCKK